MFSNSKVKRKGDASESEKERRNGRMSQKSGDRRMLEKSSKKKGERVLAKIKEKRGSIVPMEMVQVAILIALAVALGLIFNEEIGRASCRERV